MIVLPYQIPPGDQHRPIWARMTVSSAAAAVTVSGSVQNTQQLPFMVSTLNLVATPGAAQYLTRAQFFIADPGSATWAFIGGEQFNSTIAAVNQKYGFPVGGAAVVIPPLWRIGAEGQFNAGANSNSVVLYTLGWYIPRGTLALQ